MITITTAGDVGSLDAKAWDALQHGCSPFLKSGFLKALEVSGSVGPGSSWLPVYFLAKDDGKLVGAVAAYVKGDSYGEYIFDWAWASAAERAGLAYYPKLVVAVPATPATGPRILLSASAESPKKVARALVAAVTEFARERNMSSVHWLFCTAAEQEIILDAGYAARASFQFHWHNRNYGDFEEFLSALKSRKRKMIRKERQRAATVVDEVAWVQGGALTDDDLDAMDRFYRSTVWSHGGFDYLRPGFFAALAKELPEQLLFLRARKDERTVAGAIFLETDDALYGRYWGADQDIDCLHFEVAYYAAIERCIDKGIGLFEAGAQGEHKLLRGFEPAPTHSAHWMAEPRFHAAIAAFVEDEARVVEQRMSGLAEYGPYRCENS